MFCRSSVGLSVGTKKKKRIINSNPDDGRIPQEHTDNHVEAGGERFSLRVVHWPQVLYKQQLEKMWSHDSREAYGGLCPRWLVAKWRV